jgi:hypothetical protein
VRHPFRAEGPASSRGAAARTTPLVVTGTVIGSSCPARLRPPPAGLPDLARHGAESAGNCKAVIAAPKMIMFPRNSKQLHSADRLTGSMNHRSAARREVSRVREMRVLWGQVLMHMLEVSGSLVGQARAASRVAAAAMELDANSWQVCSV